MCAVELWSCQQSRHAASSTLIILLREAWKMDLFIKIFNINFFAKIYQHWIGLRLVSVHSNNHVALYVSGY